MEMQASKFYITSDLYIASSLLSLGHRMIELVNENPKRCQFIFEDSDQLRIDVDAYRQKTLKVLCCDYVESMRSLKWRLHNA